MKTMMMIAAATAIVASAGAASAQSAVASNGFESVVPFAGSDGVVSGRSAYVGGSDTSRVYGNGFDGQGRLAPHINGIF